MSAKNPPLATSDGHKYQPVSSSEHETQKHQRHHSIEDPAVLDLNRHLRIFKEKNRQRAAFVSMGAMVVFLFLYWAIAGSSHRLPSCDSVELGFRCQPEISHYWGQYSPYFSVPSEIPTVVPDQCQITFAQILSRHGARDPTSSKTTKYAELIDKIHSDVSTYSKDYAFIKDFEYTLGADQLSIFGQQQMIYSGIKYFNRYRDLAKDITPFIRTSGQDRVVESAQNWTQGFHDARLKSSNTDNDYPYPMVLISEEEGFNNTLSHGLCTEFETGIDSDIGVNSQVTWASFFAPAITSRLNDNLQGANLTDTETIYMMDLCPFNTVADTQGLLSPFCSLFTQEEWRSYDYYQSLGKYYGYGWGNPLGATQGVGFTNELIARLTNTEVNDHTSTNHTLDESTTTFPVGGNTVLYADFSHDNDMTAIFSAMGLYNETAPLLNTTVQNAWETKGYSSAWTVPFAARAYFEKMRCVGASEEFVRVVVNDRVLPLKSCGGDGLGRCKLSAFVESLSFARGGGEWGSCFI